MQISEQRLLLAALSITTLLLLSACQESWQQRMEREVRIQSLRMCPHYVSRGLIADSISYDIATNTRTDYFTLIDSLVSLQLLDDDLRAAAHEAQVREIAQDINLSVLKRHRATFRVIYRSQDSGETVIDDCVTAEEYEILNTATLP